MAKPRCSALFSLAGILLFHRIAQRLVPANALWLTAMLALGPAFAVEQNLMVDVPLLSLWLLFFDALIVGADLDASQQRRRFLVAALACSAAILVKYSSLVLLPILPIVIVYERRWRLIWIGVVPFAVILAWSAFNYLDYGHIHIAQRHVHVTRGTLGLPLRRFIALLVTLGALTPIGLIVAVRQVDSLRRRGPAIYAAWPCCFCCWPRLSPWNGCARMPAPAPSDGFPERPPEGPVPVVRGHAARRALSKIVQDL